MKKFEVLVPYSELVYGTATYIVEANSEAEVEAIMKSPVYYEYFYDTVQTGETNYDENIFDMVIQEIKQ